MTTGTNRVAEALGLSNLTRGQQLLWAAEQMNPSAPIYTMAFAFEIETEVDADVFKTSFDQLISECDALRTVVESRDGIPTQSVLENIDFELSLFDLSDEDHPSAAFHSWAANRSATSLPIDRRMFDSALVRLGRGWSGWYLSLHHIVSDAWSFSLLFERLEQIYTALRHGRPVPERTLAPYSAYVDHEREIRGDDSRAGDPTPLPVEPVSLYGLNPLKPGNRSERMRCELGETRSRRLRELAIQPSLQSLTIDLSLFRLFLTAVFAYLYRISGQESITIGAPAHNRVTQAFKHTVGLFTEVYPLSVTIDDDDSFASLYDKVRDASDVFLRSARPGASSAEVNRAVNAVMNYIPSRFGRFDGASVFSESVHSGHVEPEHHLRLHITDFAATGNFTVLFDCNRDVLDAEQRPRTVDHFLGVLDAMLADWTLPVSDIDLATETERLHLGVFNDTATVRDTEENVVGLFERRVAEEPGATALVAGDTTWTYEALDRVTRLVAGRIEPGSVVGLCLPRSPEAVIAMLGTLRAGAAYVPIDPAWPRDRIQFVVDDAGCSMVVADEHLAADVRVTPFQALLANGDFAPSPTISSEHLAYIMYTSGSSGRPKGVMIEHGSLANYATWASDFYDRGRRLTFPLFSALTFDLTVTSIFVPLISGGTIVVYPETSGKVDLAVQQVFDDDLVDIVKLTPSHLAIVSERDLSNSRVRQLIVGGEELTTAAASRVTEAFGGAIEMHNEYGPTEATVGCIVHTFDLEADREPTVPIGRPTANMRAHVLSASGLPVPVGAPGDLWLAGVGLARGYLKRPSLTAERFTGGSGADEERLYETGDRARLRADGTLEYLGRRDDQVKVRGARIELGEVEAAVASHPEVTTSAATVHRRATATPATELIFCSRCGLPSNYPNASFNPDGVCNDCRRYDEYADRARVFFKPMVELEELFTASRNDRVADYDCISLLSGGKDSTYALCRLVDMGVNVLAFTLDNGYISEEAKANMRRVCDTLGVDHVYGSTPAMNEIFVDSLQRHSNVCNGCFKTIYTLSLQVAREKGIPLIVTGLSRGQFFETRLTGDLFTELTVSSDQIDAKILAARKAYHRVEDAAWRLLDQSIFEGDRIFEQVQFVDFYRYCDVRLDEIMTYLESRVPWIRPRDTGRSTNCLINDVGIYVHKKVRGFHNYALPYSWDVRLGHKSRDQALDELNDEIDVSAVQRILDEIGYPDDVTTLQSDARLVAYYVGARELTTSELRRYVRQTLPEAMVPSQFVRLDTIPLTANGKVDRGALPEPGASRPSIDTAFVAARTETEIKLAEIWKKVLGIDEVGIRDNFFDLGGDSIMAIQIVARARRARIATTLNQLFDSLTVEGLASSSGAHKGAFEERLVGSVGLTPIQHWFFEEHTEPDHFHHVVHLDVESDLDVSVLESALLTLTDHHAALRQRFLHEEGQWRSEVVDRAVPPPLSVFDVKGLDSDARAQHEIELCVGFDLGKPPLIRAGLFREHGNTDRLVLVAHHLIVDVVSWNVIIDDLEHVYSQIAAGKPADLPAASTSLRRWTNLLTSRASSVDPSAWLDIVSSQGTSLPTGGPPSSTVAISSVLDAVTTSTLIQESPKWRAGVDELLATALVCALSEWTEDRDVCLVMEGHGRQSDDPTLDVTRTVGWFTAMFPVVVEVPDASAPASILGSVKEAVRQGLDHGVEYGVLRYLHTSDDVRGALALESGRHTLFNYLGRLDGGAANGGRFRMARPIELSRADDAHPVFGLEVNAWITKGNLTIDWSFTDGRLDPEDVERLARRCISHLGTLMDDCAAGAAGVTSASDFPHANIDDEGLAKLAIVLHRTDGGS